MTNVGVPLRSDVIPAGTGLVQSIECHGVQYQRSRHDIAFEEPVVAQISTFADGIRRVCCIHAKHYDQDDGSHEILCGSAFGPACIYSWKNPEKSK